MDQNQHQSEIVWKILLLSGVFTAFIGLVLFFLVSKIVGAAVAIAGIMDFLIGFFGMKRRKKDE